MSFLDILNVVTEYGIPSVDIRRLGIPKESYLEGKRVAYSLGDGHTATVFRHTSDEQTSDYVPSGSIIALKRFLCGLTTEENDVGQKDTDRQNTLRSILRELKIFCHPAIAGHPDIVKLLFLGYQNKVPLPVLALELGAFGSLDHILKVPSFSL